MDERLGRLQVAGDGSTSADPSSSRTAVDLLVAGSVADHDRATVHAGESAVSNTTGAWPAASRSARRALMLEIWWKPRGLPG